MARLIINLVAWNGAKYIPYLFDSLRRQTFQDWSLRVLDNGSTDNTVAAIKKELNNFSVQYKLIENKGNLGFAKGHNFLFKEFAGDEFEYMLILNQDMYLMPDCLQKLVEFMNYNPKAAAIAPRLMKWNFSNIAEGFEKSFSSKIDSLGLKVFRNRRVAERNAGDEFDKRAIMKSINIQDRAMARDDNMAFEVFGVSGALSLFRKSAVDMVAFSTIAFFDSSYQSYKEDVDLAYRLVSAGFKSYVILDAVAYHDRSAAGASENGNSAAMKNKKNQSFLIKYNSYRNHLLTLYKNEYWQNFLLDFFSILWYEKRKFIYFLIFDRAVLASWRVFWRDRKELAERRSQIVAKRKLNWRQTRQQIFK